MGIIIPILQMRNRHREVTSIAQGYTQVRNSGILDPEPFLSHHTTVDSIPRLALFRNLHEEVLSIPIFSYAPLTNAKCRIKCNPHRRTRLM